MRHLTAQGLADPARMAIHGGSAGGFTVLAALSQSDVFGAGASFYGVADLAALARDTHKFESRYLDNLVGPYPEAAAVYEARSPLSHLEGFRTPLIIFQGADDPIVPPNQAHMIRDALRERQQAGGLYGVRRREPWLSQVRNPDRFQRSRTLLLWPGVRLCSRWRIAGGDDREPAPALGGQVRRDAAPRAAKVAPRYNGTGRAMKTLIASAFYGLSHGRWRKCPCPEPPICEPCAPTRERF